MFPRTTVAVVALLGAASALPNDVPQVHKRAGKNTYDYVIVGGGISGLVAANRLSEDKKSKSLIVLEVAESSVERLPSNSVTASKSLSNADLFHRECSRHRSWRR
jgi:choline dehydrogenase-like flavoprotein